MSNTGQVDPRSRPEIVEVPELPRLFCAGEDILERAEGVHQTCVQVLRSLLGELTDLGNWNEWETRDPRPDGDASTKQGFPGIDSPK
jgi:hypothetical protein